MLHFCIKYVQTNIILNVNDNVIECVSIHSIRLSDTVCYEFQREFAEYPACFFPCHLFGLNVCNSLA